MEKVKRSYFLPDKLVEALDQEARKQGYVREKVGDILSGWDELRVSTGLGIRWSIGFLGNTLLTADLGFPLRKESGDETQTFSFSIGASRRF